MAPTSKPRTKPSHKHKGIQSRLIRVFLVQATLVSLATVAGVFAAYKIVEDVLVRQALTSEAEHYYQLLEQYGEHPLPNTKNMQGFSAPLSQLDSLPPELRGIEPGFDRHPFAGKDPLILVTEKDNERLYLIFKEEQVTRLAIFFGVAPLTLVLILIYIASWFTFRQSQRVISPVVQLAKAVENLEVADFQSLTEATTPFHGVDADIDTLATAIEHFAERLQRFVQRERVFTRDASHELRTPLAVLKGSVNLLEQMEQLSDKGETVLARMHQTIIDMESLIDTLLLLAREEATSLTTEEIQLNQFLLELARRTEAAMNVPEHSITFRDFAQLNVQAPSRVLSILFGNLMKNAIIHGANAQIVITIDQASATVSDQGPGMDEKTLANVVQPFYRNSHQQQGHGLGLSIVNRLCERFNWQLKIDSKPELGTSIRVTFH